MNKVAALLLALLPLSACGNSVQVPGVNTLELSVSSTLVTETPSGTHEPAELEESEAAQPKPDCYPSAIVSLSPTATEMLFAVGAGSQVVAVDNFSYWPPEAPVIDDLSGWSPIIEAIASLEPDLVVLSDNGIQEELELLGINVYIAEAAVELEDVYEQMLEIGGITGQAEGAKAAVDHMRERIAEILDAIELPEHPISYYHELDDTLYSVTSSTFIGKIYSLAGLNNIADSADEDGSSWGYPQLSEEYVLQADPDIIFFADAQCCGQSVETISRRPGWSEVAAVRNRNIFEMDSDISSRWGPRLVDFLETVAAAVAALNDD